MSPNASPCGRPTPSAPEESSTIPGVKSAPHEIAAEEGERGDEPGVVGPAERERGGDPDRQGEPQDGQRPAPVDHPADEDVEDRLEGRR